MWIWCHTLCACSTTTEPGYFHSCSYSCLYFLYMLHFWNNDNRGVIFWVIGFVYAPYFKNPTNTHAVFSIKRSCSFSHLNIRQKICFLNPPTEVKMETLMLSWELHAFHEDAAKLAESTHHCSHFWVEIQLKTDPIFFVGLMDVNWDLNFKNHLKWLHTVKQYLFTS